MITKVVEIRDRATFIPAIAMLIQTALSGIVMNNRERSLLKRSGYNGKVCVLLTALGGNSMAYCDPYEWRDRTWQVAHQYIIENWFSITPGDVIDVEFILGETSVQKIPESEEYFASSSQSGQQRE